MKNPFVMMAVMAAAMSAAFRENAFRDAGMALPTGGGRSRIQGKRQPAGTKTIMRFYRAKHGAKARSAEEAHEWYSTYLAEQDAKVRLRDAEARAARKMAPMRLAA